MKDSEARRDLVLALETAKHSINRIRRLETLVDRHYRTHRLEDTKRILQHRQIRTLERENQRLTSLLGGDLC